jgi:hypothetical protein
MNAPRLEEGMVGDGDDDCGFTIMVIGWSGDVVGVMERSFRSLLLTSFLSSPFCLLDSQLPCRVFPAHRERSFCHWFVVQVRSNRRT